MCKLAATAFLNPRESARFDSNRPAIQVIHDSADLRLLVVGLEPGQSLPAHASTSSVVMHVLEGTGTIAVGGEERPAGPGAIALCPPREPHAIAAGTRMIVLATVAPRP